MSEKKLPKVQELHVAPEQAFKNDQLKKVLYQEPPKQWVGKHPCAKDVFYIPIARIEFMLDRLFQEWKVEVIEYAQLFNSVSVHVRVHYLDIVSDTWKFHDGVGAVGIQTDKGKQASDMNAIKQDAVMKALPAAKSYAIKDAVEHLGPLFGRDLNRPDSLAWQQMYEANPKFVVVPYSDKAAFIIDLAHQVYGGNHRFEDIRDRVNAGTMQHDEANDLIEDLKNNLPDPVTQRGNPTATEVKNHVAEITKDS